MKTLKDWFVYQEKRADVVSANAEGKEITISYIIDVACEATGLPKEIVLSQGKKDEVVIARYLCMYFADIYTTLDSREICFAVGNRDRTIFYHAIRTIKHRMESEIKVKNIATFMRKKITRESSVKHDSL